VLADLAIALGDLAHPAVLLGGVGDGEAR